MNTPEKSCHYSYYADKTVVEGYDLDRYGFSFGRFLLDKEVEVFSGLISSGGSVLDIGTGTGKLLVSLLKGKRDVRGIDASLAMLNFLRRENIGIALDGKLLAADAQALPFADRSFDSIVSSRVLMHLVDWRQAIREFCRVSGKEVVIDFPPLSGFTVLVPLINKLKKLFYKNARTYNVFSVNSIKDELEKNRFRVIESKRLFFVPVFIHRRVNSVRFSKIAESIFRGLGLTRLFGAPVIIKAQRDVESTT